MATQWRQLFDDIGIEWKDRGRNCSRGHVNINCPYCYDDPSFHCTISESKDLFYCYRDGTHKGHALYLLQRLLGSRVQAHSYLESYADDQPVMVDRPVRKLIKFDTFPYAFESARMLDYLEMRGFANPELTCKRFNLRYAKTGAFSHRLLMPLINESNDIKSFVGRAIRANIEPSYKAANPDVIANLVYGNLAGKTVVIVEGPFDALKINSALYDKLHEISCVALTGRVLTEARKRVLHKLSAERFLVALDQDVDLYSRYDMLYRLDETGKPSAALPMGFYHTDPADMREDEILQWIERGTDEVSVGRSV